MLAEIEQGELERPIARKVLNTIYNSRPMNFSRGLPVLCDLGEARAGSQLQLHRGDIMPGIYRAPEVILGMDWDYKVDIWAIGIMVSATNDEQMIIHYAENKPNQANFPSNFSRCGILLKDAIYFTQTRIGC